VGELSSSSSSSSSISSGSSSSSGTYDIFGKEPQAHLFLSRRR
jgi:hypothetical protein